MAEVTDLDAKRKAKEPRCAICGRPTHEYHGQCPRICAITEETDGSVTYHLFPVDDDPKDAA